MDSSLSMSSDRIVLDFGFVEQILARFVLRRFAHRGLEDLSRDRVVYLESAHTVSITCSAVLVVPVILDVLDVRLSRVTPRRGTSAARARPPAVR
jgi:hypothetical protein